VGYLRNLEAELLVAGMHKGVSQKLGTGADLRKNNLRMSSELLFSENAVGGSNVNRLNWRLRMKKVFCPHRLLQRVVYIGLQMVNSRLRLSDGSLFGFTME
jgi:hypothetical protein